MIRGLGDKLRVLILGSAATGLLVPSAAVFGQTRAAVATSKKKSAVAQVAAPPQLLSVPEPSKSNEIQTEPVLELAAGEKSDVQRELEALYEQEGREIPTLNLQPLTPLPGAQKQQPGMMNSPANAQPNQFKPVMPQNRAGSAQPAYQQAQNRGATTYPNQTQTPKYVNLFNEDQTPAQTQKRPSSKMGFFKRITGMSKPNPNQAPLPPDFRDLPAIPPVSAANVNPAPQMPQGVQAMKYYVPQPSLNQPPHQPAINTNLTNAPSRLPTTNVQSLLTNTTGPELPQPSVTLPNLYQQPVPLLIAPARNPAISDSGLPPLITEAQSVSAPLSESKTNSPSPVNPSARGEKVATATSNFSSDFPNPFPDASEAEVDKRSQKAPKRRDLSAKTDVDDSNSKAALARPARPESLQDLSAKVEDDPFAVGAKNFAEPSIGARTLPPQVQPETAEFLPPIVEKPSGTITIPEQLSPPVMEKPADITKDAELDISKILGAPPLENTKPAAEVAPHGTAGGIPREGLTPPRADDEQHLEKMRKIRERFGMKGLKGFCPVTLHDDRELVDAKPEFFAMHRNQKFHFASPDARDKFEADPVKYAPAAYGADVVSLGRDRDIVEGMLDYAAWFKGRLYLFGSQDNYDAFIANPVKYATLSGIE